ncbi:MAG: hypothetical protein ABH823_00080 [bacterium]
MKKVIVVCLIALLGFQTFALALTQEEKENEYKWNKLELVKKEGWASGWSGGAMVAGKTDLWSIRKGDIPISEEQYLRLVNETEKADKIKDAIEGRERIASMQPLLFWGGWGVGIAVMATGSQNFAASMGIICVSLFSPFILEPFKPEVPELDYTEVPQKIDTYNKNLKKELGLK